jgi:predicted Rossmann-fold nucleotide-binding protein
VFPGGFGTLDELFEVLTLRQTNKLRKHMAVVLFGSQYWEEVMDFDALVRHGTIDARDLDIFHRTDSVDEAFAIVTRHLTQFALAEPGATL